ncbi:M1 family metallopeptidase [Flavivirga abyssicola]|uniref:M1 family metallopeptidase n=1 Tax=Flavivirga abyssicola TaxID=3063533 RepID=UPI0026DF7A1F|nr:M1 family metallopeptidase [Flavivirga sp. MEBiC07777]WVK13113.1 M1 family metallopeptidase [Flavivirga sp. MEBiC07777]
MKYFFPGLFLFFTSFGFSQQTEYVDFKKAEVDIGVNIDSLGIVGVVKYSFEILKKTDSVFFDAQNINFKAIRMDGKGVKHKNDTKKLCVYSNFKRGTSHEVQFVFRAKPKKALYFIDRDYEDGNKQIWTQGQGKYTSNWLPSIDDMNDKIEFDLTVTFDKDYEVIANGKLTNKQINESTIIWHYDMQKPMSSYLVALAIGKYDKKVAYSKSGIPLEMYYYPEDSLKFEPTYRYTKPMFDFLEEEIGVPYPWQNYKQVPVKDFLYAGMENTGTTIFSDAFVVDSIAFVDKNYVNVNAHELAHQWFGNLVTETSGTHHWLQEGFATYYALLAERKVFGDNYYYWRLYEYAQELLEQHNARQSTSLLDPKSSSTTFYKKGAWVLHMLREKVGDSAFRTAVINYLNKNQFKNVETDDFIKEVEQASGQHLDAFVETWLEAKKFNYDDALKSLEKSVFIQEYLMVDCTGYTSKCSGYLLSGISDEAKIKVVSQMPNRLKKEDFKNSLKVRQAIAKSISKVSEEFKKEYETFLDDKSYVTIESALFRLWNSFPQEQSKYLEKTKDIQGFNNKNIRTLWLTLALITDDFEPENSALFFKELLDYTSPKYGFEIRMNAFNYLMWISSCGEECQENLQQATKHHNWQFSKFAKEMLKIK